MGPKIVNIHLAKKSFHKHAGALLEPTLEHSQKALVGSAPVKDGLQRGRLLSNTVKHLLRKLSLRLFEAFTQINQTLQKKE